MPDTQQPTMAQLVHQVLLDAQARAVYAGNTTYSAQDIANTSGGLLLDQLGDVLGKAFELAAKADSLDDALDGLTETVASVLGQLSRELLSILAYLAHRAAAAEGLFDFQVLQLMAADFAAAPGGIHG